jgi:hypothetical protein
MKTIAITFKGNLEVTKRDIVVDDENGVRVDTTKIPVDKIIARLKNGTYKLNFFETYCNAFDGNESYEFEQSED